MARVTGPLMSFDASGSLAGSIVFSKWRGRNYVRRHAVPANPRSAAQLAVRSIMAFLATRWKHIDPSSQATWLESADSLKISAFNRYAGVNARDWRDLLAPSMETPAERYCTPVVTGAPAAAVSGRQVTISAAHSVGGDDWGVVLCRSLTTGFTPTTMNAVAVHVAGGTSADFVDGPLSPDTYYYKLLVFTTDGVLSVSSVEVSAVVA